MTTTQVALITGATQGLGLALAQELDQRGWQLVLTGRDAARITALSDQIPSATVVPGDVTDPRHRQAADRAIGHIAGSAGRRDRRRRNHGGDKKAMEPRGRLRTLH